MDSDYIADRYITIEDETSEMGELQFYERKDINNDTPTECVICIQAEKNMFTKHAHPKAHQEAHSVANRIAEELAEGQENTADYLEYYVFHYGREYKKVYQILYKKYRDAYFESLLENTDRYVEKICNHHRDSIMYHYELKNNS